MAFKTALVVDDSKSARFALRRFLENQYYKVETAESAQECHAALQRMRPDVIFLDHVMPGEDGIDVLRQLKADAATSDIKVVICSSNDAPEFAQQATAIGAVGVLVKPPSAEQLANILNNLSKVSNITALPMPPPLPVQESMPAPFASATVAPAPALAPSKVANIREPEVAIEQRVMSTLRSSLSSPPPLPPPVQANGLNEVAYGLTMQIAQLQAQAAQLQTRIDDEQVSAQTQADVRGLAHEVAQQDQRIAALEQQVDQQIAELHAALELGLRAQTERIDQAIIAAGERAREEAERTVMSAAARISDQLASSILSALRSVAISPSAPHSPAEPTLLETTARRQA